MNAASLSKSDRLQRVKQFLSDHRPHSTLEIVNKAKVVAVSALVSELRANGLSINCQRKGNRWYYKMERRLTTV